MKSNYLLIIITAFLLTGCASMFADSSDKLLIRSNDPSAKLFVNGNQVGTGSAVYSLSRGKTAIITASKAGCSDRSVSTEQSVAGATWFNLLFWPGFIVDAATGAIHKTDPVDYIVSPSC